MLHLWVHYSGLIFYLGAEFTKAYAHRYGSRLNPKSVRKPLRHEMVPLRSIQLNSIARILEMPTGKDYLVEQSAEPG